MSELASALLQVVTYEHRGKVERPGSVPIMMEFPVNSSLAPFLVSSSKSCIWIARSLNGIIRAATRKVPNIESYFLDVTKAIIKEGRQREWGNVHPLTVSGIQAAIDHVKFYDLEELEILAHPQMPWGRISKKWETGDKEIPLALLGLPIQPAPWLPKHTILIVPRDREYVGFVLLFQERIASVVHNASRGVGVATSWQGDAKLAQ
jgi:hypothetical protein